MRYKGVKRLMAAVMASVLLAGGCPTGLAENAGIVVKAQAKDHGEVEETGEIGDFSYSIYSDGALAITHYNGWSSEIRIPSVLGGVKVKSVSLWDDEPERYTSIVIDDGVEEIGACSFWGFSSLTSIRLPSSLTEIGDSAFRYCSSLQNVELPNNLRYLGEDAFCDCSSLSSIKLPNNLSYMGTGVFSGCSRLASLNIPTGWSEIPDEVFSESFITSIVIPGTVKKIGKKAFYDCKFLKKSHFQEVSQKFRIALSQAAELLP